MENVKHDEMSWGIEQLYGQTVLYSPMCVSQFQVVFKPTLVAGFLAFESSQLL
jgi:hypothetical protein